MEFEKKIHYLVEEARKTKKTCVTVLPSLYGYGATTWTVTPKKGGCVEITHKINKPMDRT